MAELLFNNIGISAISACVPRKIVSNKDMGYMMPQEEIDKTINLIGIHERRVAENETCSSDLCFKAAQKLFEDNNIDPSTIDVLLFLSQTPDYKIPATSSILQEKLGLNKNVAAIDLSLGCSGYVYGLSTAFAYAQTNGINRVLLLVGETFSKIVNKHDKVNAPLYGDAGTATLIEKGDFNNSIFTLYTDGSGYDSVIITHGECKNYPLTNDNISEKIRENGNFRSDTELYMDGMEVFNFALSVVPKSVKNILDLAHKDISEIDKIVFHQANRFMTDFFIKKLKINPELVPYCISKYGNTSSSSIPLTISSELSECNNLEKVILCGFGAGLSWGCVYLNLNKCNISKVIEY